MSTMFSAKVKGGVIVADDVDLPEGATVTVVLDEDTANDNADEVTLEQLAELDEAIAEADRGGRYHAPRAPDDRRSARLVESEPHRSTGARVGFLVLYRVRARAERIEVLALWHGARGQPPPGL